jgi:hypothetical protein
MRNDTMKQKYPNNSITLFFIMLVLFFYVLKKTTAQEIESIQTENLRKHMEFIASDDTEGRFTGSTGYKKAADYAVNVFREAGLSPGWTNEKGEKSYLQPLPFVRYNYRTNTSITVRKNEKNRTFEHSSSNFVVLYPGIEYKNIPMCKPVFIGYGIHEPEFGWDDYVGMDVEGKWVIIFKGIPPVDSIEPIFPDTLRKRYADWRICGSLKYDAFIKHKVAGVIFLPDKHTTENWEIEALHRYRFNYIYYAGTDLNIEAAPESILPYIIVHPHLAQVLLAGQVYDPVNNKGNYHSYILDNTEMSVDIVCKKESINCYNVVAVVPGIDSSLKNEYITIGAHLDHLGKIGNQVYNGANDDASGCVIILEAAKAIALNPTKRSVIFILYTSEEQNLIGSKYFLKNPPVPVKRITLNINIEQIGSKNRDYSGIWAIGPPQFEEYLKKTSDSYIKTDFKFDPIEKFGDALSTCDLWSYHQKGIPAIMLSSGGFSEHHTPKDKIDLIDFDHLFITSNFLYSFIVELGNVQ